MGSVASIEKQIEDLPAKAQREVADFVEFLSHKYRKKRKVPSPAEKIYWSRIAEDSLKKIWDNEEDDIYNELLKR